VLLQLDAAERGFCQFRLEFFRRVGVDPVSGLAAERGFLRGVIEILGEVLSSISAVVPAFAGTTTE